MDYGATDKHKTIISRSDNPAAQTTVVTNRWANTAAITSVAVTAGASSYSSGSTFSLYGVIA